MAGPSRAAGPVAAWLVVVAWFAVVGGCVGFATQLSAVQENEASSWLPESAESTRAQERLGEVTDADRTTALLVYEKPAGLSEDDVEQVRAQARQVAGQRGVAEVAPPVLSEDGEVAQVAVTYDLGADALEDLPDAVAALRAAAELDGATTYVTGDAGISADRVDAFSGIDGTLLAATLGVVVLILLVTYRSPVLWLLPIVAALAALMAAQALIYALVRLSGMTVTGQSQGILTVIVIGAGTDYALLLVARYREELRRHESRYAAMAVAVRRVAPAVVASAATVAIGLLCLMVADLNATAGLGPVTAIGVVMTLVVMLTLLPALLVVAGRWIFWPRRPLPGEGDAAEGGGWRRLGERIARRPRTVWVVTALVLAACAAGLVRLDAGGQATDEQFTTEKSSVEGMEVLAEHGLADSSAPMLVVARAEHADAAVAALDGAGLGRVGDAAPPRNGLQLLTVDLPLDPAGEAAHEQVREARAALDAVPEAEALVGGPAAISLDTTDAAARDSKVVIPLLLLVVLTVLVVLLRALVAPLLLMLTVVLSVGSALGVAALVFDGLLGWERAEPSFPLYVFVFLVALGIDYNIFLMSRVREETPRVGTRAAAIGGLATTGGVITSAGIVLAATFAVLATIPLVSLGQIGVAVALGVVIDTIVVRAVLVTALTLDLGDRMWWPGRLARTPAANRPPRAPEPDLPSVHG